MVPLSKGSYENIVDKGNLVSEGLYQLRIQLDGFTFTEEVNDINIFLVLPEGTSILRKSSTINGKSTAVKKVDNLFIFSPSWLKRKDKVDLSMVLTASEDARINQFSYIVYGRNKAGKTLFIEANELPSIKRQTFALYTSAKIFVIEDKKGKKKRKVNFSVVPLMKSAKSNLLKYKEDLDPGLYQAKLRLNYLFKKRILSNVKFYFKLPDNAELIDKTARRGKEMIEIKKEEAGYYSYTIESYNGDDNVNIGVVFSTNSPTTTDDFAFALVAQDESGKVLSYSKKRYKEFKKEMKVIYTKQDKNE